MKVSKLGFDTDKKGNTFWSEKVRVRHLLCNLECIFDAKIMVSFPSFCGISHLMNNIEKHTKHLPLAGLKEKE